MHDANTQRPVVLCLGGHDPVCGAGIQADIEAAAANGAHACSVISCLTDQDSCDVYRLLPMEPKRVYDFEQILARLELAAPPPADRQAPAKPSSGPPLKFWACGRLFFWEIRIRDSKIHRNSGNKLCA